MSMMDDISKLNQLLGHWVEAIEHKPAQEITMDPLVDQYLLEVHYQLQIKEARQKMLSGSLQN
jgi:hypothetical protein